MGPKTEQTRKMSCTNMLCEEKQELKADSPQFQNEIEDSSN